MKILNIMEGTELGGTEQSSLKLMKGLQKFGHKFIVFSLTPIGALKNDLKKNNIKLYGFNLSSFNYIKNYFSIKNKIESVNPDYIIITGGNFISSAAINNTFKDKSYLAIHFHHYVDHRKILRKIRWKLFYFFVYKKFSFITFSSNFIKNEAEKIFPRISNKSITINNPIEPIRLKTDVDKSRSRKIFGISEKSLVIGNAGWLIRRKRFDILLKVGYELKKVHKNIVILIAGDGIEKENLIEQAKDLGLDKNIIWLGWQKNLNDFYHSIDYLVFNSEIDAVGLTPLEALLNGVPSFCSIKKGGLKDILKDEYSFFLMNDHNVSEIVNRINYSINHDDEIFDLMLKCRKHILKISNSDLIVNKINDKILKIKNEK